MKGVHPSEDQLIAYALEESEGAERGEIEAHIAACDACKGVITALSSAVASVQRGARRDPPADVLVNLLEVQASRSRSLLRRWRLAPAAAAIALGIFFVTGFWAGQQTARVSSPTAPGVWLTATIRDSLPEPPEIPFHTVQVSQE